MANKLKSQLVTAGGRGGTAAVPPGGVALTLQREPVELLLVACQLEAGFLRDPKLLQGVLPCHLLDLIPVENQTSSHELIAGSFERLNPLLALLFTVALKAVFPLRLLNETDGENVLLFFGDSAVFQQQRSNGLSFICPEVEEKVHHQLHEALL